MIINFYINFKSGDNAHALGINGAMNIINILFNSLRKYYDIVILLLKRFFINLGWL